MHGSGRPPQPEIRLSSEEIFRGKVVHLHVDEVSMPDGGTATREVVDHPGAVAVVAVLPDRCVALVSQYRYAAGERLLEIPAGTLEPGEEPADCARRELVEETGHAAASLEHLVTFYSTPGFSNEKLHVYLATDLIPAQGEQDADEDISLVAVRWAAAVGMCLDGRIRDGKSIAGILAADRALGQESE